MKLPLFQVDAFADKVFSGNPAAVLPLQSWLPDETLQAIAAENNLSETAFFVPNDKGFHLRWFTPNLEVDLCGHATLATAFVIFSELNYSKDTIEFSSKSGPLFVRKNDARFTLDFPIWSYEKIGMDERVTRALKVPVKELYKGTYWVAVLDDAATVEALQPDFSIIATITEAEGLVVTAPGDGKTDFVSHFFMPRYAIDEDPVTGSAHCLLAPLWAEKLSKNEFKARQVSARGGDLHCRLEDGRVFISGKACLYLKGEISI